MNHRFRNITMSFALPLLFLSAAGAHADTQKRSFEVSSGGRLKIDTDLGSINVRSHGKNVVEVEVATSGSGADRFSVDFDQQGDQVMVRGNYTKGATSFFGWGNNPRVKFVVMVPERFDVDLETSGGSVAVDDLEGDVRIDTSGGSIDLGKIRGPVRANTSGGSIALESSTSNAELETSGGSIKVGDVDGFVKADTSGGSIHIARSRGEVDADTSGGSIRVDEVMGAIRAETSGGSVKAYISQQPQADCRLSTSGGGVTVYLADGLSVDLDAHSSGGRVSSEFEVDASRRTKDSLVGTLGGGGPELYLRSSGGGVDVRRH